MFSYFLFIFILMFSSFSLIFKNYSYSIGEGNGTPLQYSCLENPMNGGAWWAAFHGVAEGWTRLKWLSSSMVLLVLLPFKLKRMQFFFLLLYDFTQKTMTAYLTYARHSFSSWKSLNTSVRSSLKGIHSLYLIYSFNQPVFLSRWGNWTFLCLNNLPEVS